MMLFLYAMLDIGEKDTIYYEQNSIRWNADLLVKFKGHVVLLVVSLSWHQFIIDLLFDHDNRLVVRPSFRGLRQNFLLEIEISNASVKDLEDWCQLLLTVFAVEAFQELFYLFFFYESVGDQCLVDQEVFASVCQQLWIRYSCRVYPSYQHLAEVMPRIVPLHVRIQKINWRKVIEVILVIPSKDSDGTPN